MGVDNASELPPKYVKTEDESDIEANELTVNVCRVHEDDGIKGGGGSSQKIIIPPYHRLYSTHSTTNMPGFSPRDIKECQEYQIALEAASNGFRISFGEPPARWNNFVNKTRDPRSRDPQINHPAYQPAPPPPVNSTVTMPARTLDAIIKSVSPRPLPAQPRPVIVNRHARPKPALDQAYHRGGYHGRGRGRGNGYGGRGRGNKKEGRGGAGRNGYRRGVTVESAETRNGGTPASSSRNLIVTGTQNESIEEWDLGINAEFLTNFANTEISAPTDHQEPVDIEDANMTEDVSATVETFEGTV